MKQSKFMGWVFRMPLIERWSLMHCVKKEDIAQHCHQVGVIAHLLACIRNKHFGGSLNPDRAVTLAMYHEMAECHVNDISHTIKYSNPDITREFKKLEKMAELSCLRSLPEEFHDEFEELIVQDSVDEAYKPIIKAADVLSAYLKTLDELRFNNHEFEHVKINLEEKLDRICAELPEVKYFMDVFCDSCLITLDQLSGKNV